jgi:hypothetical protein
VEPILGDLSSVFGRRLGSQIIAEFPDAESNLPTVPATEPFRFKIRNSEGKDTSLEIPAGHLSMIDHHALSLLINYKATDDKERGVFRGYATSLNIENDPRAMLSVLDTLAASMNPVVVKEGGDRNPLGKVQSELSRTECILQTSEWHLSFAKMKGAFKPNYSPRVKSFSTALESMQSMFSGRSEVHIGLGLETDSQSLQTVADSSRTMMGNHYTALRAKNLDAVDRVDANRFCGSDGERHGFSISGTFTSNGIPLRSNSTSFLVHHEGKYMWVGSSNAINTSKTDISQFANRRRKADGKLGYQNVLEIFGVRARTKGSHGFYSIADGLNLDSMGNAVVGKEWNSHLSTVKKNRVNPIGKKVIRKDASGCDAVGIVTGDGHIKIVDGRAVYHIPVSKREKWNPSVPSSCSIPESSGERGVKRPATSSAADSSSGAKKQATLIITQGSAAASSSSSAPAAVRKRQIGQVDDYGVYDDDDDRKRPKDNKCDCSGCKKKDQKYVLISNIIRQGSSRPRLRQHFYSDESGE